MKKSQTYSLFFAILLLTNCGGTTTEPTPDPVEAMVGSYEGDLTLQCKDAKGQGPKETSKKNYSISRIGTTDSISIVSNNGFLIKAKTSTGSTFVFNKTDLGGEIHTGNGAVLNNKLTMNFVADATVSYGYSCVKDFSGTKKAQ
jgi:hypothetical protein